MRSLTNNVKLFDAQDENATSTILLNTSSYRNTLISVFASTGSTGTIKVKGSNEDEPAFGSAVSATNKWDYVGIVNLNSHQEITGDTGVVYTGATGVEIFEVNVNAFKWITVELTGYSAGEFTVEACQTNNQ